MFKKYIDAKVVVSGALGVVLASMLLMPLAMKAQTYFKIGQ